MGSRVSYQPDRKSLLEKASQFNTDVSNNLGFDKLNKFKNDTLDSMDEGIQKHIVNPITEAGYPNVAAGVGTAISAPVRTAAEFVPESVGGAAMSMLPMGKVTKLFNPAEESFLVNSIKKVHPEWTDDVVKKALLQTEAQQSARVAGGDIADAALAQRNSKAAEQAQAFSSKPTADNIVHDASDVSKLPQAQESARRSESWAQEYARRNGLAKRAGE